MWKSRVSTNFMTLAVAKNCKMTKIRHWWRHKYVKNVGYASKLFVSRACLDDCAYQVSSPYKVFNLVAVAIMSEKNTSRFMEGCTHLGIFQKFDCWKLKKLVTVFYGNFRCYQSKWQLLIKISTSYRLTSQKSQSK